MKFLMLNGEMPKEKNKECLKSHEHVSIKEQISKGDFDTFLMQIKKKTRSVLKTKTQTSHEHVSIKERNGG